MSLLLVTVAALALPFPPGSGSSGAAEPAAVPSDEEVTPAQTVSFKKIIAKQKNDAVMDILAASLNESEVSIANRRLMLVTSPDGGHLLKAHKPIGEGVIVMSVGVEDIMVSTHPHPQLLEAFRLCVEKNATKLVENLYHDSDTKRPFKSIWLALELLYQKSLGEESRFASYIQTLPTDFSKLPRRWSDEDLKLLSGTSINSEVTWADKVSRFYWHDRLIPGLFHVAPEIFDGKESFFASEDFEWALDVVFTRAFGLPDMDLPREPVKALVPLADMANHGVLANGAASGGWEYMDGKFVLVPFQDLKPGDEVRISYGDFNNAQLLNDYGFTLADNLVKAAPRPADAMPKNEVETGEQLYAFYSNQTYDEKLLRNAQDYTANEVNAARVRIEERSSLLGLEQRTMEPHIGSAWEPHSDQTVEWIEEGKLNHLTHMMSSMMEAFGGLAKSMIPKSK